MRRILLMLPLLIVLLSVVLLSTSTSREERKKGFVTSCNAEGDRTVTDPEKRRVFHEYCDCAGERVVNKFTESDWKKIDSYQAKGNKEALLKMMTPVIQPCLDELQKKLKEIDSKAE